MYTQRPSSKETEEDLLRFQEEFLRSQSKPAATIQRKADKRPQTGDAAADVEAQSHTAAAKDVVSMGSLPLDHGSTPIAPPVKKTRFKDQPELRGQETEVDMETMIDRQDTHISKVLEEIVERDLKNVPVYYPGMQMMGGFPAVPTLTLTQQSGKQTGKKKSLFARQFEAGSPKDFGIRSKLLNTDDRQQNMPVTRDVVGGSALTRTSQHGLGRSVLVTGQGLASEGEVEKIASENEAKLAAMSQEEILADQQQLLQMLDPSLIAFLKSKKHSTPTSSTITSTSTSSMDTNESSSARCMDTTESTSTPSMDTTELKQDSSQPSTQSTFPATSSGKEHGSELQVPIDIKKSWVHMDKVENDKLEWMKDLPPAPQTGNNETGQQARFDFNGQLVSDDAEIPTHLGLHHHGNEPERAGYSLEELFQLARSATMQQRVMALNTIARIIENARRGAFYGVVSVDILPALLDGGLIFILRWALDDNADNSIAAALHCLHSLLCCVQDEVAADTLFTWHQGETVPSLCPTVNDEDEDKGEEEDDENKVQKTDGDYLREDVCKGLVKMQVLLRLRYIADKWRPAPSVVVHVLEILTRLARHSMQASYEISQCARLLDVIVSSFLPEIWDPVEGELITSAYGYPCAEALKLVRVLCASGRHMAASLLNKYNLMSKLTKFLVQDQSTLGLPSAVVGQLQLESWRLWIVFTRYGLASESYSELYPVLSQALQQTSSRSSLQHASQVTLSCSIIKLLEMSVHLAASHTHLSRDKTTRYTYTCIGFM